MDLEAAKREEIQEYIELVNKMFFNLFKMAHKVDDNSMMKIASSMSLIMGSGKGTFDRLKGLGNALSKYVLENIISEEEKSFHDMICKDPELKAELISRVKKELNIL